MGINSSQIRSKNQWGWNHEGDGGQWRLFHQNDGVGEFWIVLSFHFLLPRFAICNQPQNSLIGPFSADSHKHTIKIFTFNIFSKLVMICIEFYSYIQCGIIFNFPFETPLTGSFWYKKFRGQRRRNAHILEPCQCFSLVLILESFACQNLHLLINFNVKFLLSW